FADGGVTLAKEIAGRLGVAHRGLFTAEDRTEHRARLVDVWSGAELLVTYLDEAQALSLVHAEGLIDARVVATRDPSILHVLPGAFHHPPDARESALGVLREARTRSLTTEDALDALLRMELLLRSSSRVKAAFAYRTEGLTPSGVPKRLPRS